MKNIPSPFFRALASLLIVPALFQVSLVTSTPTNQDTPSSPLSLPGHSDHGSPLESAALAQSALGGDEADSMAACEKLRALGPPGLDALFRAWDAAPRAEKDAGFRQFCLAVDRVSQQK